MNEPQDLTPLLDLRNELWREVRAERIALDDEKRRHAAGGAMGLAAEGIASARLEARMQVLLRLENVCQQLGLVEGQSNHP